MYNLILICFSISSILYSQNVSLINKKCPKAEYIGDKSKLKMLIDEFIIPLAVEAIKNDSTKENKFVENDFIKLQIVLNSNGEIIDVSQIESSFRIEDDDKEKLRIKTIGMIGWKNKSKISYYKCLWCFELKWN